MKIVIKGFGDVVGRGIVIAGYAGIGKTTFCLNQKSAIDLEVVTSKYKIPKGYKYTEKDKASDKFEYNWNWREEYIKSVLTSMNKYKFTVIPSDTLVVEKLIKLGVNIILVYPSIQLKDEYKKRYLSRGNTENFLEVFIDGWDNMLKPLNNIKCTKLILNSEEYLSNKVDEIDLLYDMSCII